MKEVVLQGRLPTAAEIDGVIEAALDKTAAYAKDILDDIVKDWKNKPEFTIKKTADGRAIESDSDIFTYVDEGTEPHEILPRKAKMLVFRVGGSPKTQPNVLGSGKGKRGNTLVRSKGVHHPGNAPRNFSANLSVLADKYLEMTIEKEMQALIDRLDNEAIVLS